MTEMTEQEYAQMYANGYADKGVKLTKIKCRQCGRSIECSVASNSYAEKVCGTCKRKLSK